LQYGHHHQAGHQEGGIGQAAVDLHALLQHMGEDQQVEHGCEYRRGDSLEGNLPETQQLFVEERTESTAELHAVLPFITSRKTSSRSGLPISRSCRVQPAWRRVSTSAPTSL